MSLLEHPANGARAIVGHCFACGQALTELDAYEAPDGGLFCGDPDACRQREHTPTEWAPALNTIDPKDAAAAGRAFRKDLP